MTSQHEALSLRRSFLDAFYAQRLAPPPDLAKFDFVKPIGDPGYFGPGSMTWVVFSNPVPMAVGGIAATILELAEPRVRSGVWNHSTFRKQPFNRVQRTGLAALVTAYAGREQAERLTARVRKMHDRVKGVTECGEPYFANDPDLLRWVQVTAGWGFLEAYRRFVNPALHLEFADRYYAEGVAVAPLYGLAAADVPTSKAAIDEYMEAMAVRLEPSDVLDEFLGLVRDVPFLLPIAAAQQVLVDSAIELLPRWAREKLGLRTNLGTRGVRVAILRAMSKVADWGLSASPAHQACFRVGADPSVLRLS